MFKILKGDGIKTTTFRTFGLNSVMYADRAWSEPPLDRMGDSHDIFSMNWPWQMHHTGI